VGFLAAAIARKSGYSTLDLFRDIYGGRTSSSGKNVNLKSAIAVSTVFGCSRLLGNGNAQVPLKLYKQNGRKRAPATDHSLYNLLATKPNPWQTSFEFRQVQAWHVELTGDFFAFRNAPLGVVRELIPFQPGEVKVVRHEDLSLGYEVTSAQTGKMRPFPAEAIWHVRGPSWNSWKGIDWLDAARDAIGLSIALEESAAALHKNGVRTSGAWSIDGKLDAAQYKTLRDWIEKEHAGAAATGKPMIIDRAGKWMPTQMTRSTRSTARCAPSRSRRYAASSACCRSWWATPTRPPRTRARSR
jgi:HK97 family phage portal protein